MNTRFLTFSFSFYFAIHHGFSQNILDRIINGEDTDITSVPHVLGLMLNGEFICSATIINNYWAVTAAHCVIIANDPKEISVRSGSSILNKNGVVHQVSRAIIHENYNQINNDYDIAVIKVMHPFTYDSSTQPVNLAQNYDVSKEWGLVCGWGYSQKISKIILPILSETLQCVKLPLIQKSVCEMDYQGRYVLTPRMVCYGYREGIKDACKGDSGGAIVNANNILLGITSWGDSCAKILSPGVYTDAVLLRNWIRYNIKK